MPPTEHEELAQWCEETIKKEEHYCVVGGVWDGTCYKCGGKWPCPTAQNLRRIAQILRSAPPAGVGVWTIELGSDEQALDFIGRTPGAVIVGDHRLAIMPSAPPAGTLRDGEQQMWAIQRTDGSVRCISASRIDIAMANERIVPVAVRVLSSTEPTTAGTGESDVAETKNGAHAVSVPPSPLTDLERDRARLAEELLREVLGQGVEFDDARLRYVVMQVDRTLLAAIEKLLAPTDPSSTDGPQP